VDDAKNGAVAAEKNDIDREVHAGRVNCSPGTEEQSFTGAERTASEQAAHTGERRFGDLAAIADHASGEIGHE
jgi:hypothetical protein